MGYQLTWTAQAADDLEAIAEYIERDAPLYVASVVDRILATTRSLPEYPLIGRIVPEFDKPEIRERFVFNFRIVYGDQGRADSRAEHRSRRSFIFAW